MASTNQQLVNKLEEINGKLFRVTIGHDPNKTSDNPADDIKLAFLGSTQVQVYPCGRRNSQLTEDLNGGSPYYHPFDPEARLNTELNNRIGSSANGFTRSYIKDWVIPGGKTTGTFQLTVGGYNFKINDCPAPNAFGGQFISNNNFSGDEQPNIKKIFANIRLEKVFLYSDGQKNLDLDYTTWILRNQSNTITPTVGLDLLYPYETVGMNLDKAAMEDANNYYFSGLSFSAVPLASNNITINLGLNVELDTRLQSLYNNDELFIDHVSTDSVEQKVISLCILEKVGSEWKIYQPSLLPNVRHGLRENEVQVDHLHVEGNAQIDKDLKVDQNIIANMPDMKAHFHDLKVDGKAQIDEDVKILGNLDADASGKTARFNDVKINSNLRVNNIGDIKTLNVEDAAVTKNIYRKQSNAKTGSKNMGLVTMEVDSSSTAIKNSGRTNKRRLTFYTKTSALPNITPPTVSDLDLNLNLDTVITLDYLDY